MLENGELTEGSSTGSSCDLGRRHPRAAKGHPSCQAHSRCGAELAARLDMDCITSRVPEAMLRSPAKSWLSFATSRRAAGDRPRRQGRRHGKPGPRFVRMHAAFVDFTRELAGTPAL